MHLFCLKQVVKSGQIVTKGGVQAFTKSTPTSEQYAVTYDETCKQTQKWGYYNRVLRQHQNTKNKNNTKTKLHATRCITDQKDDE